LRPFPSAQLSVKKGVLTWNEITDLTQHAFCLAHHRLCADRQEADSIALGSVWAIGSGPPSSIEDLGEQHRIQASMAATFVPLPRYDGFHGKARGVSIEQRLNVVVPEHVTMSLGGPAKPNVGGF